MRLSWSHDLSDNFVGLTQVYQGHFLVFFLIEFIFLILFFNIELIENYTS